MRWVSVALLCLVIGCTSPEPPTVLTGTVLLDDQPLPLATMQFFPLSGIGRVSYADADAAGRYRVEVSPTPLSIIVLASDPGGTVEDPSQPGKLIADRRSLVPLRYRSHKLTPLRADPVESTLTKADIELSSKAR